MHACTHAQEAAAAPKPSAAAAPDARRQSSFGSRGAGLPPLQPLSTLPTDVQEVASKKDGMALHVCARACAKFCAVA